MESLYRKYRPQTFGDVVGQKHIVATLERAIQENKLSHAYLFCGPRGTGKTTMARILAKALVCEQGAGHLPDGTCEQCLAITRGEHPDVYELDAASRTGVDNVREEIINRVDFAPTMGRSKIYIIDEVHMLTAAAFNALLKTLEEPPEHVVFVMCTTDPQKIPATILSRIQRFDFHAISDEEIVEHLARVSESEGFRADREALAMVAAHARGGMRDALSTLEQLSVFGDGAVTIEAARDMLGQVDSATLSTSVMAIANHDAPALFSEVAAQVESGADLKLYTGSLLSRLRDVYVMAVAGPVKNVLTNDPAELDALAREARAFSSPDAIARALSSLGDCALSLRSSTNPRLELEVCFTKIARPESDLSLESLSERLARLEQALATGATLPAPAEKVAVQAPAMPVAATVVAPRPQPVPAPQAAPVPKPNPVPATQAAPQPAPIPAPKPQAVPVPAPKPQPAPAPQTAPTPVSKPVPLPQPAASRTGASELQGPWKQIQGIVQKTCMPAYALILSAQPAGDDGETFSIQFPPNSSFAVKMFTTRKDVRGPLNAAVNQVMGPRRIDVYEGGAVSNATSIPAAKKAAPAPQPAPEPALASTPIPSRPPAPQPAAPVPQPKPAPAPQPEEKRNESMTPPWKDVPSQPAPAPAPAEKLPEPVFEPDEDDYDGPLYDDYLPADAEEGDQSLYAPGVPAPAAAAPEPAAADAPTALHELAEGVVLNEAQQQVAGMFDEVFGEGVKVLEVGADSSIFVRETS
jgi:DNA polymerase-3 subunit gamma/tau